MKRIFLPLEIILATWIPMCYSTHASWALVLKQNPAKPKPKPNQQQQNPPRLDLFKIFPHFILQEKTWRLHKCFENLSVRDVNLSLNLALTRPVILDSETGLHWRMILSVAGGTEFSGGSAGFLTKNRCFISENQIPYLDILVAKRWPDRQRDLLSNWIPPYVRKAKCFISPLFHL